MAGSGIPYFPLNCQLDEKFELIEAEFGLKGFAVVVKLLQRIYGEHGYYCEWTKEVELLFSRRLGFPVGDNSVSEIVEAATRRGIFSRELFDQYHILTSKGIQQRYLDAVSRRKKVEVKKEYLLIPITQLPKNVDSLSGNVSINRENADIFEQRKGEERRGKERRGEEKETSLFFGNFQNIEITTEQMAELKETYENARELIDKVSEYLASSGKSYANHYALICKIAREDRWPRRRKPEPAPIPAVDAVPMPAEIREKMKHIIKTVD